MQASSQAELNQMLTTAITNLAEAQAKTEGQVDRLAGISKSSSSAWGREGPHV